MDFFERLTKAIAEIGIPAALSGGLLFIIAVTAKFIAKRHSKFLDKLELCLTQLIKYNRKAYNLSKKSDSTLAKVQQTAHNIEESTEKIKESTQATKTAVDLMLKNQLPRR